MLVCYKKYAYVIFLLVLGKRQTNCEVALRKDDNDDDDGDEEKKGWKAKAI